MEIEKTKKEWMELIVAWNGHILNHTNCNECQSVEVKCPINKFFKEIGESLKK